VVLGCVDLQLRAAMDADPDSTRSASPRASGRAEITPIDRPSKRSPSARSKWSWTDRAGNKTTQASHARAAGVGDTYKGAFCSNITRITVDTSGAPEFQRWSILDRSGKE
jgi:hypothetical protein